jgi:glutaredoxin
MPEPRPTRRPKRLTIVLARWCPHCVPLSVRYGRRLARRLRVPLRTLDIDRRGQERAADRLVRKYGDAAPDYLIPQVFLERNDGEVEHLLTGFSEQVSRTERAWRDLLASDWLRTETGERVRR